MLLSAAIILGVIAGAHLGGSDSTLLVMAIAAGSGIAAIGRHRRAVWLPALVLVALALGIWRYNATRTPGGPDGLPFYLGRSVTIAGVVAAEPEPLDRGENIHLAVDTLVSGGQARPVHGLVLVHLPGFTRLSYGDRVSLAGTLEQPPDLPGTSPGSYRAYLAAQGIEVVMNYPRLTPINSGAGDPLHTVALMLRGWLEGGISHALPGPAGALLLGILLGARSRSLGSLTQPFIATGMLHVIAVDGLKVAIIAGMADRLAQRFLMPRVTLYATLPILWLYICVTGATPAGLRAGVMWTLALFAQRTGRRSDPVTSLGLTAALLTLLSPRILWDLGFQLSIGGTASIILLSPLFERLLHRVPPVARETVAVTLASQVGTLPLQLSGFGQLSLIAPLANALLLPLLGPIIVLGLPIAVAGALAPGVGIVLGWLVYPFLAVTIAAVQLLARVPLAALSFGSWPLLPIAGYYAIVTLVSWRMSVTAPPLLLLSTVRILPLWVAVPGAAALLLGTIAWQVPPAVYTLSVVNLGSGQVALLTTPHGTTVLFDGGDRPSELASALSARLPFWRSRLDAIVLNDTDATHVNGLLGLTVHYTIGRVLDPGALYPPAGYALWRAELRDNGVAESKLRTGQRYRIDADSYIDVLLPDRLDPDLPQTPLALRLVIGRFTLLLLNRAALVVDPSVLRTGVTQSDTVLVLPADNVDAAFYDGIAHTIHPQLIVLPSTDDVRDDSNNDAAILRDARGLGARIWQGGDGAALTITTDGTRYTFRAT